MKVFVPVSALALVLGCAAAVAGGNTERHGGSPLAQFESLDRNSDQRLSQDEVSSDDSVAAKFAALDVDGDGYVSKREFTARMQKDRKEQSSLEQSPPRQPMRPDDSRNPY